MPDPETEVQRAEQDKGLLKVCDGKDFMSRRNKAMFSVLLDTGIRLSELGALKVEDVDVLDREAYVMGKGRRARIAPFGHETVRALDRYLRVRKDHRRADLGKLWLGDRSAGMTTDGIDQMIRRRGREAAIDGLHAHMLSHTWAYKSKDVIPSACVTPEHSR